MIHRKIVSRKSGGVWYVNVPIDLRCHDPRKRRQFDNAKDAADYAKQLNDARKTNLQFFFAMHPALLAEVAFRIRELGEDHALAALRRAKEALAKSNRLANDVFAEFLAHKKPLVRGITYKGVKWAVRKLADQPRPIAEITADDVKAHIDAMSSDPLGRRGILNRTKQFFAWCVERDILEKSPADKIQLPDVQRKEIKILSVADCAALMHGAKEHNPSVIPFIALQLFGGLRAAEASRVLPDNIRNGYVMISGVQTKLNVRRAAPVSPQLAAWLAVPGCEYRSADIFERVAALKKKIGVDVPANGLRHTFCSMRFAAGVDIDDVAKAAGNSAEMLKRHYLGLASKQDGEEFARIMPNND